MWLVEINAMTEAGKCCITWLTGTVSKTKQSDWEIETRIEKEANVWWMKGKCERECDKRVGADGKIKWEIKCGDYHRCVRPRGVMNSRWTYDDVSHAQQVPESNWVQITSSGTHAVFGFLHLWGPVITRSVFLANHRPADPHLSPQN